jgi:hypothetical protein
MCVLRVAGPTFDADRYAQASALQICAIHRVGELRLPTTKPDGPRHTTSSLVAVVSDAPCHDLGAQVHDAIAFSSRHRMELQTLRAMPEVTDLFLDFPLERRPVPVQSVHLPSELVALAGGLGLGLEVSLYPPAEGADPVG